MKSLTVFVGRAWRNLNRQVSRLYLELNNKRESQSLERLGSEAHGWYAPKQFPSGARCYCIGVGRDATFDFALAERGAEVHSFDPTPAAIEYMDQNNADRVSFHPWGVLNKDSTMRLYFSMPQNPGLYFAHDLHKTNKFHEVPCYRMATIMQKLGHEAPYLVKMDIEGGWYEATLDMLNSGICPTFMEIEFDSPAPIWRVARVYRALREAGYRLVLRQGDNAVFKRDTSAASR